MAEDTRKTANKLDFTGERFMPEIAGQIAFEHLHRYYFAAGLVKDMRVLDVACGEGYGARILADYAQEVVGVDIAADVILHAQKKYAAPNIGFVEASAFELPFGDGLFDAVVSFETIEHHDQHERMLSEIKRVLRPDGVLIISSPNKQHYSIEPGYQNPFHVKELYREELLSLVSSYFSRTKVFGQRVVHGSLMIEESTQGSHGEFEAMLFDGAAVSSKNGLLRPLYDLVVAGSAALPDVGDSLFEAKVHGMDPAGFYGVHVLERLADADAKVAELPALSLRAAQAEEQVATLQLHIASLEDKVVGQQSDIAALEDKVVGQQSDVAALEGKVVGLQSDVAALEGKAAAKEQEISEISAQLADRSAQLQRMLGSLSWRWTAWLRSLNVMIKRR